MTKQSQRDEFIKWWENIDNNVAPENIADFWLQKQDQLLTEMGESLKEEIKNASNRNNLPTENSPDIYGDKRQVAWHIGYQTALNKALFLINKYK